MSSNHLIIQYADGLKFKSTMMRDHETLIERRKHKRFRVKEGIFAAFKPHWLRSTILGQIVDIGRGGLALHYIPGTKQSDRPYKLRILLADGSLSLDKIPARTVSDFEIEKTFSFGSIPIKRCGVEFGDLTHCQSFQLEHFIANHAMGEVGLVIASIAADPSRQGSLWGCQHEKAR